MAAKIVFFQSTNCLKFLNLHGTNRDAKFCVSTICFSVFRVTISRGKVPQCRRSTRSGRSVFPYRRGEKRAGNSAPRR